MSTPFPIIDAHHHLWDLTSGRYPWLQDEIIPTFRYGDYSSICRNYLPAEFRQDNNRQNVVASVHMEAEWSTDDPVAETDWLHRVAEADGVPSAIIGQAWFCRDDINTVLAGHAAYPLIRGIRQKPVAAATQDQVISGAPGTMSDPKFREGYAIMAKHSLHYDLQVPWWHLEEAGDLARDFPDTPIILNHTGLPSDRSERSLLGWRAGMEALADVANTAVKISGIGMPGEAWTVELNRHVVLTTIAIFGVERCMFASNFPVDSLVASYDTIFDGFREITEELGQSAQRRLFHDNAKRYYRIDM